MRRFVSMNKRIALAGNPNTGKSTLFNLLTGLKQHTGNWPGKTVAHAEGELTTEKATYQIIDLPGTYSLYSNSEDEEVARNYIIFEKPALTLVVLDATSIERNLNLALQVMEMTSQVIVCINLIDEARRKGIEIDAKKMSEQLGVPVILLSAREKIGIIQLLKTIDNMMERKITTKPFQIAYSDEIEQKIKQLEPHIKKVFGDDLPTRWIALRLLDNDQSLFDELKSYLGQDKQTSIEKVIYSNKERSYGA